MPRHLSRRAELGRKPDFLNLLRFIDEISQQIAVGTILWQIGFFRIYHIQEKIYQVVRFLRVRKLASGQLTANESYAPIIAHK